MIKKDSGRQDTTGAVVEINFSDLTSGVAQAAVEMPANSVVVGGCLGVETPFNSATSDTMAVTDATGATILAATSVHAAGGAALTPKGGMATVQGNISVLWTGVGAPPTQGKVLLAVQYLTKGRTDYSQG